jgi:isopenicillin N synthase-like dioxygenase
MYLYNQAATGRRETQEMIVTAFEQSGFTNLVFYDICTFLSDKRERLSSDFLNFKKFQK